MSLTFQRIARSKAVSSRLIPRAVARKWMTTAAIPKPSRKQFLGSRRMAQFGAVGLSLVAAQHYLGNTEDFFEHKFITDKKPEDLADFYGAEDFMEIFCVFPFMVNFMMRGAEFDDEGVCHAWGLLGPGELEVSVDFDEKEIDTDGDGEPDTLAWFNKKEHFRDVAPSILGGFTLWEMTQNFGYHLRDDGTCEVYHHGEKFNGLFPLRLLFQAHSRYVIWATEKYINSDAFGTEDSEFELEEQRQNIPLHVFKQFIDELTAQIEKAKKNAKNDSKKQGELEHTLKRLKTLSSKDSGANVPRFRTLRSQKTKKVARVQLVVDDKETRDTIRTAMQQIGSEKGRKHEPATGIKELNRRATLVMRKSGEVTADGRS